MIELGSRVRDCITGFEGIAIGRHDFLFGAPEVLVAPETLSEQTGCPSEPYWFDEKRLEVTAAIPDSTADPRSGRVK